MVSPAYYADLACERGRCYLHQLLKGIPVSTDNTSSGSEEQVMKDAVDLWRGGVHGPQLKNTMYYL